MLEAALKTQLATYLQRVTQPVELVATLDASPMADAAALPSLDLPALDLPGLDVPALPVAD